MSVVVLNSVDYGNAFVGGYNKGDLQYAGHWSSGNLNNIYWKETKNFADGCSAHISDSHYANGALALPDNAAFIIENTLFTGDSQLETNHHCNVGISGVLCQPTYMLSNVTWQSTSIVWVVWHSNANYYGKITTFSCVTSRDGCCPSNFTANNSYVLSRQYRWNDRLVSARGRPHSKWRHWEWFLPPGVRLTGLVLLEISSWNGRYLWGAYLLL